MKRDRHTTSNVRHCWIALIVLALALSVGLATQAVIAFCPETESLVGSMAIAEETLSEISGLVASRSQPGIIWVHNDSGDGAVVYAIDLQGKLLAKIQLLDSDGSKINAVDCEDIALGPGLGDDDILFLADIGDNAAARETIRIYRFLEPRVDVAQDDDAVQMETVCDVIEAICPDGARDAETVLVDPISGELLIVSKDFIHARAYRVPAREEGVSIMQFLIELPWGYITGGDISPDGSSILLRGYWNAEIWARTTEGAWWKSLGTSGCPVALAIEPQGEAIGFNVGEDLGYITVSEGAEPKLAFYRLLPTGPGD